MNNIYIEFSQMFHFNRHLFYDLENGATILCHITALILPFSFDFPIFLQALYSVLNNFL